MSIISSTSACCAQSTLAAYEETNKATLAANEPTNQVEDSQKAETQKFDWEKNAANLRRLKQANTSLNRDE